MGASTRHYKALMKKNFINWKRTPCGSICEIICPIMLMLILVYARSQIDPVEQENYSLYSLRRPFYPIAKPELNNKFVVSIPDQLRMLDEYRDFFDYMDVQNINVTQTINTTEVVNIVAEIATDVTGAPNVLNIVTDLKEDIRTIFNLTRLIDQTPISNFTQNVAWDSIERLLTALGLNTIIDVQVIKVFAESIEATLEDPNTILVAATGFNLTEAVETALAIVPDIPNIVELEDRVFELQGYLPLLDITGPFSFFPSHCYPSGVGGKSLSAATRYNSPVIAYVKTGASVEQDIISQLEALFSFQKSALTSFATADLLGGISGGASGAAGLLSGLGLDALLANVDIGAAATAFVREDEIKAVGDQLGNRFGQGENSNFTDTITDAVQEQLGANSDFFKRTKSIGNFTFKEFESRDALDEYIASDQVGNNPDFEGVCFGFAIHENEDQNKYELELMFSDLWPGWLTAIPTQKDPFWLPYENAPDINAFEEYTQRGFMHMQNWVANTILKRKTGNAEASIVSMVIPSRLPPFTDDEFAQLLTGVLSFFMIIMYVPPLYRTAYRIVQEKESKVKESMRMMGLKDFPYWLSWFTYYTFVNTCISILTWIILVTSITKRSNSTILFLLVWLFGQSLFGLLLITQSVFTKARAAAITTSIVYFGTSTFQYFVTDPNVEFESKLWASLSPTVAMIQTVACFAKFEGSAVGVNWDNIFEEYAHFSVGHGLIMSAFDCVWLTLVGLYLEAVMPKTLGQRRGLCYCFTRAYWGCKKRHNTSAIVDSSTNAFDSVDMTQAFETKYLNPDCYEKLTNEMDTKEISKSVLKVSNIKKEYENGFKAVNGMNFKMYSDQIFCLLGHNGAGKTTTISMLTGLLGASEGEANLFGIPIFDRMDEARKTMGVCPQHDVLFDLLTPQEHLDVFYEFKGADKANKKKEIDQLLNDIGVADKKDAQSYQLSGGNKRKLSVAIALCGGSKFVLLDEPTSGLDIQARRQLWNMLRQYKKDRIILLTTHYMDEADILGDRIGIMTAGKMTCLGSSLFLKSRFGVGYVMTIVKSNPLDNKKVMPYLHEKLGPAVTKLSEIQGEMTIQIPREYTALFKLFFTNFDDDIAGLDIQTYGISITTLEQVFIEIGHDPNPKPRLAVRPLSATPSGPDRRVHPLDPSVNGTEEKGDFSEHDANTPAKLRTPNDPTGSRNGSFLPDISRKGMMAQDGDLLVDNRPGTANPHEDDRMDSQTPLDFDGTTPIRDINDGPSNQTIKIGQIVEENPQDEIDQEKATNQLYEDGSAKFSISSDPLNTGFCNNFMAVLIKRFNGYRRSKKRVVTEILLPSAFMILGIWMSSLDFTKRSPSFILDSSVWPNPQKMIMNENIYDPSKSDLTPLDFAKNLPHLEDFDITFKEIVPLETFDGFAEEVYQHGINNAYKSPYMYSSYEIFQANKETHQYKFSTYANLTSFHAAPFFSQYMYESILKVATGDPEFEFKTRSTPYPPTYELRRRTATSDAGSVIFFAAIAYSIVITVTISYLVVERITQLKHVQVITGMRLTSYWIANFIFDALKLYVTIITTIVLFNIFDQHYESATYVFILFPFGIMPFTYVMSFLFTADSAAQTFTMFCHMVVILAFSTLIFILRVVPNLEVLGDTLHWSMRVFPSYSLATALYTDASIKFISQIRNTTEGAGDDISPDVWDFKNNTFDILMQVAHFFFWTFILFLIEADLGKRIRKCYQYCRKKTFPKRREDLKIDPDVTTEQQKVAETPPEQFKIKVQDLRKVYPLNSGICGSKNLVAVENISFGLEAGECFALLGVNGAGKSTTFKSLTSEVEPTEGSVHIGALDIRKDFNKIKKLIGYCPQTNPIFEYMSVEENIEYFARIKGIPANRRSELCNKAIVQLDLDIHRKKLAGALSGGNKRKLSVALAIVGSPPIILLDEPSAGMDPEARRFMWRVVAQIASDKTSAVILTTHSMEEAEALSSKMGIMVKGGIFKCFGTSQHIKDKFGTGFVIEIKAQMPLADEIDEVRENILNPEEIQDPELKEALKRPVITAEEASRILTEAQVPGIVIESILQLDKQPEEGENDEETAEKLLKKEFTLNEIAQEIFVKGALFGVIESMCHEFNHVEVIEHYGSYMRLRVERHNKSIGFLFKLIEELKEEHQLEDYSVSQTTLEQIFQGFADLKFNENVPTYCIDEESGELAKIQFE